MEIVGKYNLYRKIEAERVTASGIIIPDTVVIPSSRYECVGVGEGSMVDIGQEVLALNVNELEYEGMYLIPHENVRYNLSMGAVLPGYSVVKWVERKRDSGIILPEAVETQRVEVIGGLHAGKEGVIRPGRVLDMGGGKFIIDNDDIVLFVLPF